MCIVDQCCVCTCSCTMYVLGLRYNSSWQFTVGPLCCPLSWKTDRGICTVNSHVCECVCAMVVLSVRIYVQVHVCICNVYQFVQSCMVCVCMYVCVFTQYLPHMHSYTHIHIHSMFSTCPWIQPLMVCPPFPCNLLPLPATPTLSSLWWAALQPALGQWGPDQEPLQEPPQCLSKMTNVRHWTTALYCGTLLISLWSDISY